MYAEEYERLGVRFYPLTRVLTIEEALERLSDAGIVLRDTSILSTDGPRYEKYAVVPGYAFARKNCARVNESMALCAKNIFGLGQPDLMTALSIALELYPILLDDLGMECATVMVANAVDSNGRRFLLDVDGGGVRLHRWERRLEACSFIYVPA